MAKADITLEDYVREYFFYDPETGILRWRKAPGRGARSGDVAGSLGRNGYWKICANYRHLLAHRVAFFLTYDRWPTGDIDHINGERADNRICNLRDVSKSTNSQNIRKPMRNNTSGILGIRFTANRWTAAITVNGKVTYLGRFKTAEEAQATYLAAKRALHPGCTI